MAQRRDGVGREIREGAGCKLAERLDLLVDVIPEVAYPSTLIYVPEVKFYDVRYPTTRVFETNVPGLFVAGLVPESRGALSALRSLEPWRVEEYCGGLAMVGPFPRPPGPSHSAAL